MQNLGEEKRPTDVGRLCKRLGFQVDTGLAVEYVAVVAAEYQLNGNAGVQLLNLTEGHVGDVNDRNDVLVAHSDVQVDRGTHHFVDRDRAGNASAVGSQSNVLRTEAQLDLLLLNIVLSQALLLVVGQDNGMALQLNSVLAIYLLQLNIVENVHLGRADEACNEQVLGVVEHFLRRADLLDEAVLHNDDTVTEGHSLDLVVGNVDKGGVDTLAEL